jgi:hypothetical protein
MKKERSRAYPVLDLEAAYRILVGTLARLGNSRLDREALAETLGYSSAGGGIAARKVSALVQYGLLDYRDNFYELSSRGHRLQSFEIGTEDFLSAARIALEKPSLFRNILSRYHPLGRVPENLAQVLTEDYGITARASEDAEGVFIRSAVFAGVLDAEGRFRKIAENPGPQQQSISSFQSQTEEAPNFPFPLLLGPERFARLAFPPDMSIRDLEILEKRLQFEIENGILWDYLGLKKPAVNPAQGVRETQEAGDKSNLLQIRNFRETS